MDRIALKMHFITWNPVPHLGNTMNTIKKRGRPVKYPMPERIDADPETIATVVLSARPKKHWRFEEVRKRKSGGSL